MEDFDARLNLLKPSMEPIQPDRAVAPTEHGAQQGQGEIAQTRSAPAGGVYLPWRILPAGLQLSAYGLYALPQTVHGEDSIPVALGGNNVNIKLSEKRSASVWGINSE